MKKIIIRFSVILVIFIALIYGSTHRSLTSNVKNNNASSTAKNILMVGSTAMQPLSERASALYMKKNNDVSLTVQGGGSGTGLTQVSSGAAQIGESDIFSQELKNINSRKIVDHKVAVVGIAPVINKSLNIRNISTKNLQNIFRGKITNWKQIGGPNLPISVINRASGSGTRAVFEDSILKGKNAVKSQEQDSNGTVQKIVSKTPGSISYLTFYYISGERVRPLKIDGVKPTPKNVMSNKWKIWGYEHMYTNKKASGEVAKFIKFFKSPKIQKDVVKKLGYIPIKSMHVTKNFKGEVLNK
mgnify:CR=1 FL=1